MQMYHLIVFHLFFAKHKQFPFSQVFFREFKYVFTVYTFRTFWLYDVEPSTELHWTPLQVA